MTPQQTAAIHNAAGSTLAQPPMLITLRARADLNLWECSISVKREDEGRPFSKRADLPTSEWPEEIRQMVIKEATVRLAGVGEIDNSSTDITGTHYILRRHFSRADRNEIIYRR